MPQKGNPKDIGLQKSVENFLKTNQNLSGYDINVRVINGSVFLQGIVDTLSDANQVQKAVKSIEGVGEIQNNLTVSTDGAVNDRHVYMEVRQELEGDPRLRDTQVKVSVKKGEVTLRGKIASMDKKHAVQEAASKAMGVKQIIDHTTVSNEAEVDDAGLMNEVRRSFVEKRIDNKRIRVSVKDRIVSLKGEVSIKERNRALDIASKVPGVRKVNTYLINTEKGELSRAARAAVEIKKSFSDDHKINRIPIRIYEKEGRLILEGMVGDLEQKKLIDEKLRSVKNEFGKELIAVENKIRLPD
ncbi:MAG: BON domain-containing protein [Bacillota bacterium]|nr:BON domain-containing protein [Bacillota bacterium]